MYLCEYIYTHVFVYIYIHVYLYLYIHLEPTSWNLNDSNPHSVEKGRVLRGSSK